MAALNDPAISIDYICYLIKFDSTHGKFKGDLTVSDDKIIINGMYNLVANIISDLLFIPNLNQSNNGL